MSDVFHGIQKFTYDGSFLTKFAGTLGNVLGIAVDESGNVFAAGGNAGAILQYTSTGDFLTSRGGIGTGDGQFQFAEDVAADRNGSVFVSDRNLNRVQKFTRTGDFVTKWGSMGTGDAEFTEPNGVAVDKNGNVFVADPGNARIQKFTNTGTFLTKWGLCRRCRLECRR